MKKKSKKPTLAELFACRSVKAIVALLKKYKIKGRMANSCDCPLANFARQCGVPSPSVNTNGVIHGCDGPFTTSQVAKPSKIRGKFIDQFDENRIPELVA